MSKSKNLFHELLIFSNLYPEKYLSIANGQKIKYRHLIERINTVSTFFYQKKYKSDDYIVLNKDLSIETIIIFYAAYRLGLKIIEKELSKNVYAIINRKENSDSLYITKTEKMIFNQKTISIKNISKRIPALYYINCHHSNEVNQHWPHFHDSLIKI